MFVIKVYHNNTLKRDGEPFVWRKTICCDYYAGIYCSYVPGTELNQRSNKANSLASVAVTEMLEFENDCMIVAPQPYNLQNYKHE